MDPDLKQANAFIKKIYNAQKKKASLDEYKKIVQEHEKFIEKNCDCPTKRNEQGYIKICTCHQ